jgi:uncharacterized membrane protein
LREWKVDKAMALWGILFGIAATIGGLLFFGAIKGGFIAEGFFLIVISWVLVLLLFAKLVTALRNKGRPKQKDDGWE